MQRGGASSSFLSSFIAPVFVLLWSTGYIGAKFGLPYAEPLTFLSIRFGLVVGLMLIWVLMTGAAWPSVQQSRALFLVGALLHGVYLGGVFTAIWLGLEAGLAALIVCMQPILSAFLARWFLRERMTRFQWLGLFIGLAGAVLVVSRKLGGSVGDWGGLGLCVLALLAISVATIYQKMHCADAPMRSGAVVQYVGALVVVLPLAFLFETREVEWSGEFIFSLSWLVIVLSLGAVGLLMSLIQRGEASKVASLFFLVPPCTALMAWAMFGEALGWLAIIGVALAAVGVAMVMRGGVKTGSTES